LPSLFINALALSARRLDRLEQYRNIELESSCKGRLFGVVSPEFGKGFLLR
jgi:hypothetical protein